MKAAMDSSTDSCGSRSHDAWRGESAPRGVGAHWQTGGQNGCDGSAGTGSGGVGRSPQWARSSRRAGRQSVAVIRLRVVTVSRGSGGWLGTSTSVM